MVLDQQVQNNPTNYIKQYLNLCDELESYLDSSIPNLNKQNELLARINRLSNWIRNDDTLSHEDKYTLLGDDMYE